MVIRLKQGVNSGVVLNTLFKYTPLQSSFSFNNVALVKGRPRTLSLKEILHNFVDFRHEVVVRRTKFELDKAKKRAHILEGLLKAMDIIDEIVHVIRYEAASIDEARQILMDRWDFSEIQATEIVNMRLRQLVGLEREKLQNEYDELMKFIVTGDATQIDLPRKSDSGLLTGIQLLKGLKGVAAITFRNEDIVRHPLVTKIVKAFDEEENRARNFEDA